MAARDDLPAWSVRHAGGLGIRYRDELVQALQQVGKYKDLVKKKKTAGDIT